MRIVGAADAGPVTGVPRRHGIGEPTDYTRPLSPAQGRRRAGEGDGGALTSHPGHRVTLKPGRASQTPSRAPSPRARAGTRSAAVTEQVIQTQSTATNKMRGLRGAAPPPGRHTASERHHARTQAGLVPGRPLPENGWQRTKTSSCRRLVGVAEIRGEEGQDPGTVEGSGDGRGHAAPPPQIVDGRADRRGGADLDAMLPGRLCERAYGAPGRGYAVMQAMTRR